MRSGSLLAHLDAHEGRPGEASARWVDPGPGWHVIERDDGAIDVNPAAIYFTEPEDWPIELDRQILDLAEGRVLDVGAGAGRFTLPLLAGGHEVVALDVSAGAVEVCRRRGVERTHLGTVFDLAEDTGPFETFVLAGNNLGLLESAAHAPRFLGALHRHAAEGARILGTGLDPLATTEPRHLAYHERNRRLGRLPGQLRLRVRHLDVATTWWDYLLQRPDDLAAMVDGTGWRLTSVETDGALYLATLATT